MAGDAASEPPRAAPGAHGWWGGRSGTPASKAPGERRKAGTQRRADLDGGGAGGLEGEWGTA